MGLKTSAVYNGMDVGKYVPQYEKEHPTPLAVMLSHVARVKDVATAVKAAGVIVQQYGLSSYQLHVYGSLTNDPGYAQEVQSLIASLDLQNHVFLKGFGNPKEVLAQGWVFVNSSVTEGLPLALGEAALAGIPVVCTDVGGSREVVGTWGRICSPQKHVALATC